MPKITESGGPSDASTDATPQPEAYRIEPTQPHLPENVDENAPAAPPFNPSELSVAEVNDLLSSATEQEKTAVIAAERADKNRKGITGGDPS